MNSDPLSPPTPGASEPPHTLSGLDLPTRYLKLVQEILASVCPQVEVWVYGSRVTGHSHEVSDLDLVLRNPANLHASTHAASELKSRFVDSNLPIRVDVSDWALIPEHFRDEINRAHVVIQP